MSVDGFYSPGSAQNKTSIVAGSQPYSVKSAGENRLKSVDGDVDEESILSPEDMTVFQSVSQYATERNLQNEALGDSIQSLAEYFLGLPYRGYQLDQSDREILSVNLRTFDCVIFVETMLALARNFAVQDYSVPNFLEGMQAQRYRNGEIDGYCSRLHYFTDWIGENERQGRIRNITGQLGGISVEKQLDFMTSHREAYPQLIDNDENYRCIAEMEAALSPTELTYIPIAEIREIYSELRAGDIVAIATSTYGLDVSHTSFIHISEDGNVGVIHSDIYGVKVEPDLQQFLESAPNAIGAIIARPNSLS
ncbi:MAG: N-acetylmuramoyl-L-alanine amidase-like domain-containing protein [Synechococcus sp.]